MFVDTHCHLDHPSLAARLPEVMEAAALAGVRRYIVPGVGPSGWESIAALAKSSSVIFPAYGLHPMLADLYQDALLRRLELCMQSSVAVGEIGLDYGLAGVPRELQLTAFRSQLQLAVAAGLPVLLHCRKAFPDLLRIMKEEKVQRVGGVMHAFSGSSEIAGECIKLGLYISISGTVTYLNARRPAEVAAMLPLDHLLLETDAPDMTPEPYRGRSNEPAFLPAIARKVAEIRGISLQEVAEVTTKNAERLFGLKNDRYLRPPFCDA
jgi:TatD DNase family protein